MTVLVQPVVRETADRWAPPAPVAAPIVPVVLPGMRPASLAISPTRVAGVQRGETRSQPMASEGPEIDIKPVLKQPRRMVREGCETALSSLVGPEARRMTPGRCIS
ncbi:hypothetical protein Q8W71_23330 [Methylobacterium sp. NEAU 140]|uniref:hypothetical protein n=1 Tax=Methylobacterium sp. NEAU 140 TaxID=3064945 RepID=UPI002732D2F7|nr:hypothetical protein [Methylobacterium sp. NEAU 140]MDP4025572.1 hypothetical protein [Methylobacterium sp. NEAU 140]